MSVETRDISIVAANTSTKSFLSKQTRSTFRRNIKGGTQIALRRSTLSRPREPERTSSLISLKYTKPINRLSVNLRSSD